MKQAICGLDDSDTIDIISLKMFEEYNISSFLKVTIEKTINSEDVCIETSDLVPMNTIFDGKITKIKLLNLLKAICVVIDDATSYLLDPKQIVLADDKIYIDKDVKDVKFTYIPIIEYDNDIDVERFIKKIIFSSQFESGEDGAFIIKLMNYINKKDEFNLHGFYLLIEEMINETSKNNQVNEISQIYIDDESINDSQDETEKVESETLSQDDLDRILQQANEPTIEQKFGSFEPGETMVLSEVILPELKASSSLVYLTTSNGEKIDICKESFVLGKEKNNVDYRIENNSAISRKHAQIVKEFGVYYLIDKKSLNFTYLNGIQLIPEEKYPLKNKDVIMLADEEFIFNMQ